MQNSHDRIDKYELHEALHMLCSLLLYKKFAIEFVDSHGLQMLINLPRVVFTANDIAMAMWHMANFSAVMEKV
jgi:hypothetical protein